MTKLIAECSFDFDGKTYEYELGPEALTTISPETDLTKPHPNLYAVTEKAKPGEEQEFPSPKEFGLVRVRHIKPFADKEYEGNLKKVNHLFFR